jgi:hypothetical protein
VFVKFNAGLGSMDSHGKMNDEDFDPVAMGGTGYSNTLSTLRDGAFSYATVVASSGLASARNAGPTQRARRWRSSILVRRTMTPARRAG